MVPSADAAVAIRRTTETNAGNDPIRLTFDPFGQGFPAGDSAAMAGGTAIVYTGRAKIGNHTFGRPSTARFPGAVDAADAMVRIGRASAALLRWLSHMVVVLPMLVRILMALVRVARPHVADLQH